MNERTKGMRQCRWCGVGCTSAGGWRAVAASLPRRRKGARRKAPCLQRSRHPLPQVPALPPAAKACRSSRFLAARGDRSPPTRARRASPTPCSSAADCRPSSTSSAITSTRTHRPWFVGRSRMDSVGQQHLPPKLGWQVLKTFGFNDPQLGGKIGAHAILHTHSLRLDHHPHAHFVVPAGALSPKQRLWRSTTNRPRRATPHPITTTPRSARRWSTPATSKSGALARQEAYDSSATGARGPISPASASATSSPGSTSEWKRSTTASGISTSDHFLSDASANESLICTVHIQETDQSPCVTHDAGLPVTYPPDRSQVRKYFLVAPSGIANNTARNVLNMAFCQNPVKSE